MKRKTLLMAALVAVISSLAACAHSQGGLELSLSPSPPPAQHQGAKVFDYRVAKSFGSPDTYAFAAVGPQKAVTLWSADKSFSFQANYGPVAGSNLVGGAPALGYSVGAFLRYDDQTFFGFVGVSAYGLVEQGKPISGTAGLTAGFGWHV